MQSGIAQERSRSGCSYTRFFQLPTDVSTGSPRTAAASLAFVWNTGSLLAMTARSVEEFFVDFIVAISFSALSLLPEVPTAGCVPE